MRCPDCNKFVAFDSETDPEITVHVDNDGNITGSVRIVNNCAECGQELKANEFDVEADVCDLVTAHREEHKDTPAEHDELSVSDEDGSRTDRLQNIDRKGKPIKNPRYMKHLYGAEATFNVSCKCGEEFTVSWSDEVAGSAMEEMV